MTRYYGVRIGNAHIHGAVGVLLLLLLLLAELQGLEVRLHTLKFACKERNYRVGRLLHPKFEQNLK
jgi:hypothetical protein